MEKLPEKESQSVTDVQLLLNKEFKTLIDKEKNLNYKGDIDWAEGILATINEYLKDETVKSSKDDLVFFEEKRKRIVGFIDKLHESIEKWE